MRMDAAQLEALARDREQRTPEWHTPNDFYGHAAALKAYAGLPPDYSLRAVVEHAPFNDDHAWRCDLASPLPAMFVFGPSRLPHLRTVTDKQVYPVGPYIHYAAPSLSPEELAAARTAMGRTLLVFPAHSSHTVTAEYDRESFCRTVDELAAGFDTVLVCVYWKNILEGDHRLYMDRGYACTTAGHMFDPGFLGRLKSILLAADACLSNNWGTFLGYAAWLGKPFCIRRSRITIRTEDRSTFQRDVQRNHACRDRIYHHFEPFSDTLRPEQYRALAPRWGFDHVRSPRELAGLIRRAEALHEDRARQEAS
jgi:hypothetical protein